MSGLSIVLWIGGAWLLLRVLPVFMGFLALLRIRLQPTTYRTIEEAELDPELVSYLRMIATPLAPLGFIEVGFLRARRAVRSSEEHSDLLELLHPDSGTLAAVSPGETPDRWSGSVTFWTETHPPRLTMNGLIHGLIDDFPGADAFDPYAPTIADAAEAHLFRLNGVAGSPISLARYLLDSEARDRRYLESLVEKGLARAGRELDTFELTVKGAYRGATKMSAARGKLQKMAALRRTYAAQHPELFPEPPLSEEMKAYRRHEDVRRSPNRRQTLALIFVATAALFVLSMLQLFDAAAIVVLVGVVFFHELGHYFAMRLFDYRDTTIFFIPFLGAAATGRKDRPSLAEEMIILLAGPMPGLLLGAALGFIPEIRSSELGREVILMLVAVNLFNLLPIFPLDGGRIVHALLFAGRPWLDAVFKLVAVASFGGLGLFAGEGVLVMIAMFVALTIPIGFRIARMEAEFRTEERTERPADTIRWIFARLRLEKPAAFVQKLAVARQLEQRLAHQPTRWWRTIPWLGAYGGCIAGGVFAIALGSFPGLLSHEEPRSALSCPVDVAALEGKHAARLSCIAPDEKTALELQESLVLAEVGASYCVPPPWSEVEISDEARAARRRALLTLRIAQHRLQSPAAPGDALQALMTERAEDPEFDRETVERFSRVLASEGAPEAQRALAERVGGSWKEVCDQAMFFVQRVGNEVTFGLAGDLALPAQHLCKLGCEIGYQ